MQTCNPIARECSSSGTDLRQAMTMGIMRRKVRKTTRNVIRMKGTRKLHSVAQFSLRAPPPVIHWQSVKFPALGLDVQPPWHGERYMTESDPQTGSKERFGQSQAALQSDFTVVMVELVEMP